MSDYTTEVRFICENLSGLSESVGGNSVNEIIAMARGKIFNFDYPIFDENYRAILETKILKHYYTREIGLETVGLWKLNLDRKLNEIMPYYNQLYKSELLEYNPLYTINTERKGNVNDDGHNNEHMNWTDTRDNDMHSITKNKDLYSDTPQGSIKNLENETYLTNAEITTNDNTVDRDHTTNVRLGDDNRKIGNKRDYNEEYKGFMGTSGSKLLLEFRKTFLNIDMLIIEELNDLFMNLW